MVLETPQIIKEATAGSHLAVWGEPHFTQSGMFWFTLFFGTMGLHHVMLRAPLIGLLFFLGNILTSGYWFWFDLLQLYLTDTEDLNKYGMGSPFLFEYGVAVGMWQGKGLRTVGSNASGNGGAPNAAKGNATAPAKGNSGAEGNVGAPGNSTAPAQGNVGAAAQSNAGVQSAPQTGGYRQWGGASNAPTAAPKNTDAGSLKESAGKYAESLLKIVLDWVMSKRKEPEPKIYDWDKRAQNSWTFSWWIFLFILCTPIGPVASIIAGDMWSALFHCTPLFMFFAVIESLYMLLFPMHVFINGVSRPFPFPQLFTSIDVDGQSTFIQRTKIAPPDPEAAYKSFEPFIDLAKQGIGIIEGLATYIPAAGLGKFTGVAGKYVDVLAKKAGQPEAPAAPAAPLPVQKGGGRAETPSPDTVSLGIIGAVIVSGLLLGFSRSNVFQGNDDSPPHPRGI